MNTQDEGLRRYLGVAKRWWWLLAAGVLIPAIVSYYFASKRPDLYQAQVTLMVGTSLTSVRPDTGQMATSNTLADAYASLVKYDPITKAVVEQLGLPRSSTQLAAQISTWVYPEAQLLEIRVVDSDPELAALIANALAVELIARTPTGDPLQQTEATFIKQQLDDLRARIEKVQDDIQDLSTSMANLTSAVELNDAQERLNGLRQLESMYQSTYGQLLASYAGNSPSLLQVFDPAVIPQQPLPSEMKVIVGAASAAGLALAVAAILLVERLDTSLNWSGSGAQSLMGLPVLGTIPHMSRRHTALSAEPMNPVAEGARAIRVSVFLAQPDDPPKTLLVTSPGTSEGKTFILANLGLVLASSGYRVVLVDADMRRPRLHELFDLPNLAGLADWLSAPNDDGAGQTPPALTKTHANNLRILTAGRPQEDPVTLLASPRFAALLESLSSQADIVLIDAPPVLGPPDATVLATLADGTALVATVGMTRREALQQAKDHLLKQRNVRLLGVAINRVKPDGGYYYYQGYGSERDKVNSVPRDASGAWLSLREAAARLGISLPKARQWCATGRLPAEKKQFQWRIKREAFEQQLETGWDAGGQPQSSTTPDHAAAANSS